MNDAIASKIEHLVEYVNILKGYQRYKREEQKVFVFSEGI
jgi:hypothetical protein